ncbi:MAG: hypothetical protein PHF35_05035 [Candidatus Moranbacteria bacterium]|nr:hypothetical protein [Candidatus Moranbacteria bacterium]
MKVFQKLLKISLPVIKIVKIKTDVVTPQKTLSKLDLDDAVGSGATLNQVACKLKKSSIAKKVFGFSITGSAKGFDVISEV